VMLDNNKFMVFFMPFNPDSSPNRYGSLNGVVIFDSKGSSKVIKKRLSGDIDIIKRDPYGGVWISHPWTIEGTNPALSYTMNGLEWRDILLPDMKTFDSTRWLGICLLPNDITLRFRGENRESFWKTSYRDALSSSPHWKSISKKEFYNNHCLSADAIYNNWKSISNRNGLTFVYGKRRVTIPKKIPIKSQFFNKYSIQVGHFKLRESLNQVSRELNEIIGYPLISKEIAPDSYKLFLGTFDTPAEAREALERLKRKYRKNRYINEAFIVKL